MTASLIAVRGHRLAVAFRQGGDVTVRTAELATPGGHLLAVAAVGTPSAAALLRRTLRPLLAGTRPAAVVVLDLEPASALLFVPRQAEHRLATIAAVLAGGDPTIAARTRRIGGTEASAIHRLLLYNTARLAPVARALRGATGRELPVLDPALAFAPAPALAPCKADDPPAALLRVWREPGGEQALVAVVRAGALAHTAWIPAPSGLGDDALEASARELAEDLALELGSPVPVAEVVHEEAGWASLLGPLLALAPYGEAHGIAPLRTGRHGAERARWRLAFAAAAAIALACAGAWWSRATLARLDSDLAAHVDAARRAHVEAAAAGAYVQQLERAADRLEAGLAADPAAEVLAAVGALDPEILVLELDLTSAERSAPPGAASYAGTLRARFRRELSPGELAARVAAAVATLARQDGISGCRLSVVPEPGEPEFAIAFAHDGGRGR